MITFPVVWFIVVLPHSICGLWTWNHYVLCSFQLSIYNAKIKQLQSAWDDETSKETSNQCHILEPVIGRLFKKIILRHSLRGNFIYPFSFAMKCCNTSQGFGAFSFQSFFSSFFLDLYGNWWSSFESTAHSCCL